MHRLLTLTASALAAVTAAGLGVWALPATAAPAAPQSPASATPYALGRVVSNGSLVVRALPYRAASSHGSEPSGATLYLQCKVRGQVVDGNTIWYRLPNQATQVGDYVSARYVRNIGAAPHWCGSANGRYGTTTQWVNTHVIPDPTSAGAGPLARHTLIRLACKVDGPRVGGNPRWYFTVDHRWVPARYVANVGHAPAFC